MNRATSPRKSSRDWDTLRVHDEWLTLPAYEPAPPDENPMFREKRPTKAKPLLAALLRHDSNHVLAADSLEELRG